ncbi:Methylosome subunit pICln [Grifola frondosa]|uniref:Methylosome subunit pICln n=1 Tax=Grifola frondosa TaxID=5627 RepID=A0A1C7M6D1_GRIFR|nr:Methylosome subunit pICln [Grifola frondosa]
MAPPTLITSLPIFISPEEHRNLVASTPASFSDIPPVIRHKEENVSVTVDPPIEGFTPEDCANGTLYVIESVLVFMSATGRGFQVEYPSITLHAISRADSGPSIYCQLDDSIGTVIETQGDEDAASEMKELIIIPKDASALEPIFESLSLCASLHPDPASLSDDMDDAFIDADENTFETFNGSEAEELSEVGRAALAHLESIIYNPFDQSEQFEDAEEASDKPAANGIQKHDTT